MSPRRTTPKIRELWRRAEAASTSLIDWLRRLFRSSALPPIPPPPEDASETPPAQASASASRKRHAPEPDVFGEFYFRDDVLDRLDSYFGILARMKNSDADAYDYFAKVGANVVPKRMLFDVHELSPWFAQVLPHTGAVMLGGPQWDERKDGTIFPRMLYFTKYKSSALPRRVQPVTATRGAVYIATVYWEDVKNGIPGTPTEFPVVVSPGGAVEVLKVYEARGQHIRSRRGPRAHRGGHVPIPTRHWAIPQFFKEWATGHGMSPEQHLREMFVLAANAYQDVNASMTRVAIRKGGLVATIGVNIERTPYFFQDRDARDGRKRKIFHIVRTHQRDLGDGRTSLVRTHFRGERRFTWNGYDVSITVPGWHHAVISGINIASADEDAEEARRPGSIGSGELGQIIASAVDNGKGAWKRKQAGRE